ncbi:hypothetical protein MYA_0070 [Burkholderia sp. KJ006]|nr:hypothetical protein MYA_0070 [Burkholderia sp. KJ006]
MHHVDGKASLLEAALDTACDGAVVFDQKESHEVRSSTMGWRFRHADSTTPFPQGRRIA